ncbi:uncharacterized protein isoform X2 [Choristoneura fumiferana]|uniref:uncharacterized protein isoform X2 n=1 Tax=Choristoneura fumiferana TaxID=7141 RepID=UPI003D156559
MKSSRSLSVSVFSSKTFKDKDGASKGLFFEPELNFEKELFNACAKYECPGIVINKGVQNGSTSTMFFSDEAALLVVDALYDNQDELAEIIISRAKDIPRKLMQCIGLLCPYFKYLTKISIIKSSLNVYTLHELSKILQVSHLSDVYLDESFLSEANYAILLNEKTKLRNLSLSKCRINDDVCGLIASKLGFTAPAAKSLILLNLSSNHITDIGMKSLAKALRTNRCLRYLNLADNRITDDGAFQLLDVLKEFPLTCDEIKQKRARYIHYLREKRAIYMDYFDDDTRSLDEYSRKSTTSKRSKTSAVSTIASTKKSKKGTDLDTATRAELMSLELLGPYVDPYSPDCTKIKDGSSYCLGNLTLAYLNLAYNSLSYLSLKRIKTVLLYQSGIKIPNSGLMKLVIDGNPFPNCNEFDMIGQLLVNNVFRASPEGKRKPSAPVKPTKK